MGLIDGNFTFLGTHLPCVSRQSSFEQGMLLISTSQNHSPSDADGIGQVRNFGDWVAPRIY